MEKPGAADGGETAPSSLHSTGSQHRAARDRSRRAHAGKHEGTAPRSNGRMRTRSFRDATVPSDQDNPRDKLKKYSETENGQGKFLSVDKSLCKFCNIDDTLNNVERGSYMPSAVSSSSEYCFQLFIRSENGIRLYIDLNSSSLLDWLKSRAPEPLSQDSYGQGTAESSHSNSRFTISNISHHCSDNGVSQMERMKSLLKNQSAPCITFEKTPL